MRQQESGAGWTTDCLKALRTRDALVVWRLDCLGRNLPDLVQIVGELEGNRVGLESITEKIETVSTTGKLAFYIFAALADNAKNAIIQSHSSEV
jgi:DNA invertase Pin-like site-specific DNA recombinase